MRHDLSPRTENKTISKAYSYGKVSNCDMVKYTVSASIHLRSFRIQCENTLIVKRKYNEFCIV